MLPDVRDSFVQGLYFWFRVLRVIIPVYQYMKSFFLRLSTPATGTLRSWSARHQFDACASRWCPTDANLSALMVRAVSTFSFVLFIHRNSFRSKRRPRRKTSILNPRTQRYTTNASDFEILDEQSWRPSQEPLDLMASTMSSWSTSLKRHLWSWRISLMVYGYLGAFQPNGGLPQLSPSPNLARITLTHWVIDP